MKTTVTVQGRWLITIPKSIREGLNLKQGDILELDISKVKSKKVEK